MENKTKIEPISNLQTEVQRMMNQQYLADNEYYLFHLFASENDKLSYSINTQWAGFLDNDFKKEIRETAIVKPQGAIDIYKSFKEPVLILNDVIVLIIFIFYLVGNVIIEKSLADIKTGLDNSISGDLLALDIRRCLHYLGEITGEITNEDQLDYIFSKFCIGK